jgi:hypothetical protein
MPNTRGNVFSRGNYQYSHREHEYWYHSIDEYALIDNPVMIDKALAVSGASKLAFVGHSQVQRMRLARCSGQHRLQLCDAQLEMMSISRMYTVCQLLCSSFCLSGPLTIVVCMQLPAQGGSIVQSRPFTVQQFQTTCCR